MNTPQSARTTADDDRAAVKAVRQFNRFYTARIGILDPYLGGELPLTDVRVLYELAHRERAVASDIGKALGLDPGYLSRILRRFEASGWLSREPDPDDARQQRLSLTEAGHGAFAPLQQRSREEAAALLAPLAPADRKRLVGALEMVQDLLDPERPRERPHERASGRRVPTAILRDLRPGDLGWVVQQHGEIYAREYGLNADFEALVAEICARFQRKLRPDQERGWIAELEGERVGSIFLMRKSASTAQLRLLVLTEQARGLGLGAKLTDTCLAFARDKGYRKVVLWTQNCLTAARSLYAARGFELTKSEAYEGFGQPMVGETWELKL